MASSKVKDIAVGIDLGTTNSCVAVYRNGQVHVIPNETGARVTPSTVAFEKGEDPKVGIRALEDNDSVPVVFGAKRLIGRWADHASVKKAIDHWPFKIIPDKSKRPQVILEEGEEEIVMTPEDICAQVLGRMKKIAEDYLDQPVTLAVVTVPAQFDDNQRTATKQACEKAGLEVLSMINEPTAAAIAYAVDKMTGGDRKKRTIVVYDVGGGTLDVTVLLAQNGTLEVLATYGHSHLAGEDFTQNLYNYLADLFRKQSGINIKGLPGAVRRLRKVSEETKIQLSNSKSKKILIECLAGGKDFSTTVSRQTFEEINEKSFRLTISYVASALVAAKVDKSQVDDVVLVGGSSRIPRLQSLLEHFFDGKALKKSINPDEAVAMGAAIRAASLTNNFEGFNLVLKEVVPVSMGIGISGGFMDVIIERFTEIPTIKSKCYAMHGNETGISLRVFQGMRPLVKDNTFLGSFKFDDIKPGTPGSSSTIVVSFEYNSSGILQVSAYNKKNPNKVMIAIISRDSITDEDLAKAIEDSTANKESDEEIKEIFLSRSSLQKFCGRVQYFMGLDEVNVKIEAGNRKVIHELVEQGLAMCAGWQGHAKPDFDEQLALLEDAIKNIKSCHQLLYEKHFG